jgi:tRNA(Ile)-lysidine synthase
MLDKFKKHINSFFPFLKEKKLLIAISGGLDSVVLAHLLHKLNFDISFAHCNFKLRKEESDTDEEFVINLGNTLATETFTTQFDTNQFAKESKLSTQIAARELRYNWFQKLVMKHDFDYVLTAHHADDNFETFLINLTRGTGLDGLTGIPVINENIVRPLLIFSREEIENHAKKQTIEWREDQSNASTKYVRNKIRHQITPVLKEINPQLLESFQSTIANLQESQSIIKDAISDLKKRIISKDGNGNLKIDVLKIKELSNPKAYLFEILKEYGFTGWNDVVHLLNAQTGKQVLSKSHRLLKDRDFLLVSEIKPKQESLEYFITEDTPKINTPIHLTFETVKEITSTDKQFAFFDAEKTTFPLTLRKWKSGDYFHPSGMQGKKKLSKFFKDEKYSLIDKENTWLLCSENNIVWIVGKRTDQRFLASSTSKSILKLHISH